MYGKTILTVLVTVALLAFAVPGSADHGSSSEAQYIAGNGLVASGDPALPGPHVGGGSHLENPAAPERPGVSVVDDVHGELSRGDDVPDPLEFAVFCYDDNTYCNVFVGAGAVMGTITLS